MEAVFCVVIFMVFVGIAGVGSERKARLHRVKHAFDYEPEKLLGNAGFATDLDCKKAGLFSCKGIPAPGYSPERGHPMRYEGDAMLITVAPVGSGKGTAQIIPACLSLDDRSLIVFCPKGETPAVIAHHRQSLGPCHLINPYEPEELKSSFKGISRAKYNPMARLTDPREPILNFASTARSITEGCTFRETDGADEFWNQASADLIQGVIMGVARHELSEKRNLVRVAEIIMSGEIFGWSRWVTAITKDPAIRQRLGRFKNGNEEDRTLAGVLATATAHLSFLADPAIGNTLSGSDLRFRDFRDRVSTALITVPVSQMPTGGRFFRLLLPSILGDLLRPGCGNRRVLIIIDEAFSVGALSSLETFIGIARGFGVQIWTIWQDLSQLEGRYPRTHQTFLSNAGVRTFMTPQDAKTANYISDQIGVTQVAGWQKSVNFTRDEDVQEGWSRPASARPLMHPHEVRALPEDRMFVFVRGMANVILAKRIPYFKRSEFRGKYRPNPYFRSERIKSIFGR